MSRKFIFITVQVSFSRRLRQRTRKKKMKRGHLALQQGDAVSLHPLLVTLQQGLEMLAQLLLDRKFIFV
jgi:preprotein translocase subunit YajC